MRCKGRWYVDAPKIVHQTIDGEVIAINMESGSYYTLQDSGVEIWELLTGGANEEEVVAHLQRHYSDEAGQIEPTVAGLLVEMENEGLIRFLADSGGSTAAPAPPAAGSPAGRFVPPKFDIFRELTDLLLIDPIHEVTDRGWPHAPAA